MVSHIGLLTGNKKSVTILIQIKINELSDNTREDGKKKSLKIGLGRAMLEIRIN
jgi:hypothetical protein